MKEDVITVTFQLKGKEVKAFEKFFINSGFRSKSELIRAIVRTEMELDK